MKKKLQTDEQTMPDEIKLKANSQTTVFLRSSRSTHRDLCVHSPLIQLESTRYRLQTRSRL